MPITRTKSQSLQKLREFCSAPPRGMFSSWWFNGLVKAYPLQFLFYSQFSTIFKKRQQGAKDVVLSKFECRVKHLLEYPISEREIKYVEKIWSELDELIDLNKKINNN
jgi:hypothetical protein